jgi:DNA protecting protein DprA
MITYKSLEGLVFLTYLTKYSIDSMMKIIKRNPPFTELGTEHMQYSQKEIDQALSDTNFALGRLEYLGITALPYFDDNYPQLLKSVKGFPPILYYKGAKPNWEKNLSAVVGSRKISDQGKKKTIEITQELTELGYGIVSGLAVGVDTIAHEVALSKKAYTLAVLPNSLDTIYPKENVGLANRIISSGGTLMSELLFGINRGKKSFVARNRIQSGISSLVVPTELRVESGTMHTIRFAYTAKRPVCLPIYDDDSKEDNGLTYILSRMGSSPQFFTVSAPDQIGPGMERIKQNPQGLLF